MVPIGKSYIEPVLKEGGLEVIVALGNMKAN